MASWLPTAILGSSLRAAEPGESLHLPGDRSPVVLRTRPQKASSAQAGSMAWPEAALAVGPRRRCCAHGVGGRPRKWPRLFGGCLPCYWAGVVVSC